MKKKYPVFLLAAAVCAGIILWAAAPYPALLGNDGVPEEDFELLRTVEIRDSDVPLAELPEPDQSQEEDDPFAAFTEEQRDTMNEVLDLVNEARADAGVAPLDLDPALCSAAQVRARECVGTFSHTRPDGTKYKTAIAEAGVVSHYTGENVATGHVNAKQVVAAWLRSEGHRNNILNEKFTKLGVGFEPNTGNRYRGYAWSQLFVR